MDRGRYHLPVLRLRTQVGATRVSSARQRHPDHAVAHRAATALTCRISRASPGMMWPCRAGVLPRRRTSVGDLRRPPADRSHQTGGRKVGLEVSSIGAVTLSDGEGRGECAQCRRYARGVRGPRWPVTPRPEGCYVRWLIGPIAGLPFITMRAHRGRWTVGVWPAEARCIDSRPSDCRDRGSWSTLALWPSSWRSLIAMTLDHRSSPCPAPCGLIAFIP
jgi:hypothetical protein